MDATLKQEVPAEAEFNLLTEEKKVLRDLSGHASAGASKYEIVITGLTPREALELYGDSQFDYEALRTEFKKICTDFGEEIEYEKTSSQALYFAVKVIYTIGPESRLVKRSGDKIWKMRFTIKVAGIKRFMGTVWLSTFKYTLPPKRQPTVLNRMLVLTIEQASLLATETICRLVEQAMSKKICIMTPLAGAIFSKEDMYRITSEIMGKDEVSYKEVAITTIVVIQSCQRGGQYLNQSDCSVAVVAALAATKTLQNKNLANSIVSKVYKKYLSSKKDFNIDKFRIFAKYASGGIPLNFTSHNLKLMEQEEVSKLKRANFRELESAQRTNTIKGLSGSLDMQKLADEMKAIADKSKVAEKELVVEESKKKDERILPGLEDLDQCPAK